MPLVTINLLERVFSDEQKREMIRKVTDAIVSIEGEAMRGLTWVMIKEIREGNWGIGGQSLANASYRSPTDLMISHNSSQLEYCNPAADNAGNRNKY